MRVAATAAALLLSASSARAQVLFQQFYYPIDNPSAPSTWWQQATAELPELTRIGIHAVWHPVPVKGGSGAQSMGYDPYDLYDLGSKDQRGSIATRFGTRDQYLAYVAAAHANGMRVYADVVLNHSGGADAAQENPVMAKLGWDDIADDSKVPEPWRPPGYDPARSNLRSWTFYAPKGADGKPGTGRFPRDWRHFHPSATHSDRNEPYNKNYFLEDYCHEAEGGYVATQLIHWGNWFKAHTGVDGYRLDAVKLVAPSFLNDFAAAVTRVSAPSSREPFFLVGEFWDTNQQLLNDFQKTTQNRISLFDFGLYYALKDMSEKPGEFDMRDILKRRFPDRERSVSFVSNHDVDRDERPMPRLKRALPYAIILTMSGRPSVFYRDYFKPEDKGLPGALTRLIPVHNRYAVGKEIVRHADADVLVLEREKNLLAAFNDGAAQNEPRTVTVPTGFGSRMRLRSLATKGAPPVEVVTDAIGQVTITIPGGDYLLLARADSNLKTHPDRFLRSPYATSQEWEFADDLDTGRLGATPRVVAITAAANTEITARMEGDENSGDLRVELRAPSGQSVARASLKGRGRKPFTLRHKAAAAGVYRFEVSAPGQATGGRLRVTYTAPAGAVSPTVMGGSSTRR